MKSKSVLITGGARGIGRAISIKFAQEGYNVLINYNNSKKEAEELKNYLKQLFPSLVIETYKADITKKEEVQDMIKFASQKFCNIDVLVNNSGCAMTKLANDIEYDDIKRVFDLNVFGTFNVIRECLASMISKKSGSIINISSIWGITGASMEVLYSSSKAAVIGMSKALAKELGPSNIRVNVVAPGWIETDMTKCYSNEEKAMFCEDVPLQRLGNVEDIANAVYFLATDESSYITGQVLSPNGGYLI